ncbi:hypothetical protein J6590_077436 [Homalodisca vitripennis]|nr:hypothetical protein J6590_077436 [Homalodisca vitripennis]
MAGPSLDRVDENLRRFFYVYPGRRLGRCTLCSSCPVSKSLPLDHLPHARGPSKDQRMLDFQLSALGMGTKNPHFLGSLEGRMRAGREMRAVCPTALKHVVVGPEGHTKTETQYPRPQPVARRLYPKFRRQQPSVFVTGLALLPPPLPLAAHKWAQGMCRQTECLSREFLRLSAVRVNKERVMRGGGVEYKHVASVSHVYGVGKLACLVRVG